MLTKKKHFKTVFLLTILLVTSNLAGHTAWFHAGWSDREKITIKASQVDSTLTNFPIHLNLQDLSSDFFTTVNGTGADIRITQGDEISETAFELVDIDTVNGTGELWFKAPSLSSSTDTDFYIYYGNGDATAYAESDTYGTHNVWTNGFVAVYHFSDDPTVGTVLDSTSNSFDGTSDGITNADDSVKGRIGKAFDFDGINDSIDLGTSASLNPASFTFSAWFEPKSLSHYSYIWSNSRDCCGTYNGYSIRLYHHLRRFRHELWNGTVTNFYSSGSTPNLINTDEFYFVSFALDAGSGAYDVFTNDRLESSGTTTASIGRPASSETQIGEMGTSSNVYEAEGKIDEIHFSNKKRSQAWTRGEYRNQNSPGNFYLIENGNDAGFDQSFWSNYEKITIPASEINGDLSEFPVYINFKDLSAGFFATVDSAGADIRVTTSDKETQVPFELVNIDTANGEGELWFKADTLSSSTDTDFYIWYGNSNAVAYDRDDEFGSDNVWTEYEVVYHFSEDPVNGSPTLLNSAKDDHHGTPQGGMAATNKVEGQLGSSYDFEYDDSHYVSIGNLGLSNHNNGSVSMWVNQEAYSSSSSINMILDLAGTGTDAAAFYTRNTGLVRMQMGNGSTLQNTDFSLANHDYTLNQWNMLSYNWSNTDSESLLMVNENYQSNTRTFSVDTTYTNTRIGGHIVANRYFDGKIDELRIAANVSRNRDWTNAEYLNQKAPGNFYLVGNGDDAGFDSSLWSDSHKITIPAKNIDADLENFPVYIDLSHLPASFFATVDAAGADIRITTNDQMTQIPFEIVEINTGSSTGELWFKAPNLSALVDTDFYIWYGNATAVAYDRDDEFGSDNVWTDYIGVWHMNEDPNGDAANAINESTANQYHATPSGSMTSTDLVTGQLGRAVEFDGTDDEVATSTSVNPEMIDYTVSFWFNAHDNGTLQRPVCNYQDALPTTFFCTYLLADASLQTGLRTADGLIYGSNGNVTENTWTYYASTRENGALLSLYDDARLISTTNAYNGSVAHDQGIVIGNAPAGTTPFDGPLDEVRISSISRSQEWIKAEYLNQKKANAFYDIDNGTEDTFVPGNWSNKIKITIPSDRFSSDLTDFPVYFNLQDLPNTFFTVVQDSGCDIRMTLGDASTQIATELVNINTTNGTGELWFKAPTISSTIDNDFYIYYGNSSVGPEGETNTYGAEAVWSNNYVLVYHMNEDPSGVKIFDSTANNFHGSPTSMAGSDLTDGIMGKSIEFHDNPDRILVGSDPLLNPSDFTLSTWFTPHSLSEYMYFISNDRDCCGSPYGGSSISLHATNNYYQGHYWNGGSKPVLRNSQSAELYKPNFISYTNTPGAQRLYVDGDLTASGASAIGVRQPASFDRYIGVMAYNQGFGAEGLLDEVRIASTPRTADWVETEYLNQDSPGNMYTVQNGDYAGFDQNHWSNYEKITIPASEVNGDLTEFPVYINFKDLPANFFSVVDSAGADIRVTNGNKMYQVPFELVELDTVNGEGELWFKADLISSSIDTDFYIWYGNPTAQAYARDDEFGSENVWTEGYVGVWHMNEDPTGTINDSTSFTNTGTSSGAMTSGDLQAGQLGNSVEFDGSDDHIIVSNAGAVPDSMNPLSSDFTASIWFNTADITGTPGDWDHIFSCGYPGGLINRQGYTIRIGNQNSRVNFFATNSFGNYNGVSSSASSIVTDEWYLVNAVKSGSNLELYLSGQLINSSTISGSIDCQNNTLHDTFTLGKGYASTADAGHLDEAHLTNVARSRDWIATEYLNQDAPGNFYMINNGDDAGFDQSLWSNNHRITVLASQVNGDLTNFPVYVDLDHLPASFYSLVNPTGADIRITNGNMMTQVPFEIVELDIANGTGELWFKADFLSSSTDTDFWLWYNNPTAVAYDRDDEFGSENVWTEGYKAVYHLKEDPSGLGQDSTAYENHMAVVGGAMTSSDLIEGQLGSGWDFEGVDDRFTTPVLSSQGISMWMNLNSTQDPGWDYIIDARVGTANSWYADISIGSFWDNQYINGTSTAISYAAIPTDHWSYFYIESTDSFNDDVRVMASSGGGETTAGLLDEVHFSEENRSPDWIRTEYLNQYSPADFYNIDNGIEDPFDPSLWSDSLKITIPAAEVNADLTNFPVYLSLKDLPASFFGIVETNGDDIRMTQSDATTQIAHELVEIDTVNGEGELWFKAPLLSSSSDNYFYIHYGNADALALARNHTYGSEAVWSDSFEAVYHLNQDPSGGANSIIDSTANLHHGTPSNFTSSDLVETNPGSKGYDFTDGNNQIDLDFDISFPTTLTAWTKFTASPNGSIFRAADNPLRGALVLSNRVITYLNPGNYEYGHTVRLNQWDYYNFGVPTSNGTDLIMLRNDTLNSTTSSHTGSENSFDGLIFGGGYGANFTGYADEIRISSNVKSLDWVSTEYYNQNAPGNFYLVDNGNDAGFDQSFWSNYEKITIPASEINGDLTEFPVYINFKDLPASFFSTVDSTGADIRVTNGSKMHQLPFELVEIDTVNGEGELWFKADLISSATDTDFYIWYGNPTAVAYDRDDEFGSENVWTEGYKAVYHLNDDPSSGMVNDSTNFNNHGTIAGSMTLNDSVSRKNTKAFDFDGVDDYIYAPDSISLSPTSVLSMRTWVKTDQIQSGRGILHKGTIVSDYDYMMYFTGTVSGSISNYAKNSIGTDDSASRTFAYNDNAWHSYTMQINGSTFETIIDGGSKTTTTETISDIRDSSGDFRIARGWAGYFKASMDEVRISTIQRSLDWLNTEFKNENSPGNFYMINNGDDAGFDQSLWSNNHRITVLASQVNGDLTNFPVYVDLDHLPASFYSLVNPTGADIRITNGNMMTQVPFEIVELDIANGTGELWFKADFLSSSTDTDFWLWYNNPTAVAYDRDDEFGSENVWTDGYVGVYHMNDNPGLGVLTDSTLYNNHGSGLGAMTASDLVNGQLGKAFEFDGIDDSFRIEDDDSLDLIDTLHFSTWLHHNPGVSTTLISKDGSTDPTGAYNWYAYNTQLNLENNNTISRASTALKQNSTWQYIGVDFENGRTNEVIFYFNDIQDTRSTMTSFSNLSHHLNIGRRGNGADPRWMDGMLDEIHLTNKVRNFDWVKAEYINQKNAKRFYNIDNGIEDDGDAWVSADWSNRLQITISASQVNGSHTDFPVYIDLADLPASFFSTVQVDGEDIRITGRDGQTRLPFELVSIDTGAQAGELHFKAPLLQDVYDNNFYIYYGNTNAHMPNGASDLGSQAVWSNGYIAVYHMNQDPSPAGALILDSTRFRNHGIPQGTMTLSDLVNGQMGQALDFDGSDDFLDLGAQIFSTTNASLAYTVNSWIKTADTSGDIVTQYPGGGGRWTFRVELGDLDYWKGTGGQLANSTTSINDDSWRYVSFTKATDQTITLYINDVADGSGTDSSAFGTGNNTSIGYTTQYYDGLMDEVRIASKARSSDWIWTEYNNHNSPSSFYSIGSSVELKTDTDNPKVIKYSPETKTVSAPRRHPLRMLFDKVVNVATGNFNIYQENGNIFETIDISSGQVTGDGTIELIITPTTYFTNTATYYVLIDRGAIEDTSSNEYEGIADPEAWKFTIQGGVKDQKPLHIFDGMI